MSDARDVIAGAQVDHCDYVSVGLRYCTCGQWAGDSQFARIDFARHSADAILAALDAAGMTITTTGEQP